MYEMLFHSALCRSALVPVSSSSVIRGCSQIVARSVPFRRQSAVMNGNGDISVERIYQKKTQLEHILLRPDTYIGSVEPQQQSLWVYDGEDAGMQLREVTFVPGLYKIFDEIIVNAADHKQRDKQMDTLRVDIDPESNKISIYNNGRGIDVVMHKVEKVYVPTLIFGHLLTGANFDDDEKKVVGGRNGYGAKLCNIFSTKFTIETSSKKDKKSFKQTWTNNMADAGEPVIKDAAKEDFTRITFYPDLSKFNMKELDKDIVSLMSRRAYDIAGSTKGVRVFLNGNRLPVKGFKDYVDLYLKDKEDEQGNALKPAYEACNDRWEIAVTVSTEKGFQQVSFVNSIATTKGGRHVDHVTSLIVDKVAEAVKKKHKKSTVKPFQIKNHMWVFVNCLIENPAFDSQTKENLNTQVQKFGSKCTPSEKFLTSVLKTGIVEAVSNWVKFKEDSLKDKACSKSKHSKIKGIPKLEDANDAGTRNSADCTLILTEGDSAKTLVVAGFGVIGRDKYGVFPLKGKLLNVREATSKQISENAEIGNIIKILGLQYKKKYETPEDLKTLRYGKLMIMTDQDHDGSHIKGLLINFIHHNWPSLLKMNFLEEFITPIVKVWKGKDHNMKEHSFYSIPEFEEWKSNTANWSKWEVKYYKGLGTSKSEDAKKYFSNLIRHRIKFKYDGVDDDHAINLAFSKKMVDARKDWLIGAMESRKMRRELGLPEVYLYGKDTRSVTYKDFVNKELVLFSNLDNERSIPSVMDGLKPGQRKVLFTCLKKNIKKEMKVAQLAGLVGSASAYHHGEASLMQTIIGLAQNFVGSNNINLLQPEGQFGTRLTGGKDAASPRYIFTMLSDVTTRLFHPDDAPILNYLVDDNQTVEPEYYVPIIPMVLVNGAEGIGTGWSTKVPNYNPRDIVANLKRMLQHEDPVPLKPWFNGFRGEIDQVDSSRFIVNGEVAELDDNQIEITELPIRTWTQTYKEQVMEAFANGSDKTPACITEYKEYHTNDRIRFLITLPPETLRNAYKEGVHKFFKLQTSFTTSSMVLFDSKGCLKRYESPDEILKEFYDVRIDWYDKRKTYWLGKLQAEADRLTNQARFIVEKISGKLVLENKKKDAFMKVLAEAGYDPDPVLKWEESVGIRKAGKKKKDDDEDENGDQNDNDAEEESVGAERDYDYLTNLPIKNLLVEKKDELLKKKDNKLAELARLEQTRIQELWERDLDQFLVELDKHQKKVEEESKKTYLIQAGDKVKGSKGKANKVSEQSMPSADGRRIPPKIDFEAFKKQEAKTKVKKEAGGAKAGKKNGKNGKKESDSDTDEDDDDIVVTKTVTKRKSYSDEEETIVEDEIGAESPDKPAKKMKSGPMDKFLTKKKESKPVEEKAVKKPPPKVFNSDSSGEESDSPVKKPQKKNKKSYDFSDDDDEEYSPDSPVKKKAAAGPKKKKKKDSFSDDGSDEEFAPKKKQKSSDDDYPEKPAPKSSGSTMTMDKPKKDPVRKEPEVKHKVEKAEKAKKPEKKVEKKKKKSAFDTDSDDEDDYVPLAQRINSPIAATASTTGRQRKPVSYAVDDDSDTE
jgi:DNA topoisomerase-2